MLDLCEANISGSDVIKGRICGAYAVGIADGSKTLASLKQATLRWCKSAAVTVDQ